MRTVALQDVMRKQLLVLRNEAVWARRGLAAGHQPPAGFDAQVLSALATIAAAGLDSSKRSARYQAAISKNAPEPWELEDIDRVIDRLDDVLKELTASPIAQR